MYTDWDEKHMDIPKDLSWYLVTDVISYLKELRCFIIETPNKFSLQFLPRLTDSRVDDNAESKSPSFTMPATSTTRFPSDQLFICDVIGNLGLLLDELQLAANIMVHPNRLERKYPSFSTAGELENCMLSMINSILQSIEAQEDLITQQVFEKRYTLNWSVMTLQINDKGEEEGVQLDNKSISDKN